MITKKESNKLKTQKTEWGNFKQGAKDNFDKFKTPLVNKYEKYLAQKANKNERDFMRREKNLIKRNKNEIHPEDLLSELLENSLNGSQINKLMKFS